jgi:hypothetical protein
MMTLAREYELSGDHDDPDERARQAGGAAAAAERSRRSSARDGYCRSG